MVSTLGNIEKFSIHNTERIAQAIDIEINKNVVLEAQASKRVTMIRVAAAVTVFVVTILTLILGFATSLWFVPAILIPFAIGAGIIESKIEFKHLISRTFARGHIDDLQFCKRFITTPPFVRFFLDQQFVKDTIELLHYQPNFSLNEVLMVSSRYESAHGRELPQR
ncbi:MAG: hypothetical protein V4487_07515 [Chlamydiota bacterium]